MERVARRISKAYQIVFVLVVPLALFSNLYLHLLIPTLKQLIREKQSCLAGEQCKESKSELLEAVDELEVWVDYYLCMALVNWVTVTLLAVFLVIYRLL